MPGELNGGASGLSKSPLPEKPEEVRDLLPGTDIPTRPPRAKWYWVEKRTIDSITNGGGSEELGIACFCIGSFLTCVPTLVTAPDLRQPHPIFFTTWIVVSVTTALFGAVYLIKWFRRRRELSAEINEITRDQYT